MRKLFDTNSEKEFRATRPIVDKIEVLDGKYFKLTDEQLKAKTPKFKQRIANGESLDDILPEAFAACRGATWRVLGMKPYRVQLIGGIILHQGRIIETKIGEGKTLVATLSAYLSALAGEGVHIVTVNNYLTRRDSEQVGKAYRFLGLTAGLVIHDIQPKDRKASYTAGVTCGTNNESGFDYLQDNMVIYAAETVQWGHAFAIMDEVDSALIDETHIPLIISGQGDESTQPYTMVDALVAKLRGRRMASVNTEKEGDPGPGADYVMGGEVRTVTLTVWGTAKAEQQFQVASPAGPGNTTLSHHINRAIRARGLIHRDIDYMIRDGEVIIVGEFTGRPMYGRWYFEGLHQAIEVKEGVTVARESKTLVIITFQNYFRLYGKFFGITGAAMTKEGEFGAICFLGIVRVPTSKPVQRADHPDATYETEAGKFRAIVNQIEERHKRGQPVLVDIISIERPGELSAMLRKRDTKHNVLNIKLHEKEAEIVAQVDRLDVITVTTNMAGHGTDVMLGGNAEYLVRAELRKAGLSDELIAEPTGYAGTDDEETLNAWKMFVEAEAKYKDEIKAEADQMRVTGGLFIPGTERHESHRIDSQLRGRVSCQGDPGESHSYLPLENDIVRLFGSEWVMGMMGKLGMDEDTPIDAEILSSAIKNAQKQVEFRNFQTHKTILEYDDVMNTQRKVIYEQHHKVLDGGSLKESVQTTLPTVISIEVQAHMGELKHIDIENWREMCAQFRGLFLRPDEFKFTDEELQQYDTQTLTDLLQERVGDAYACKEAELDGPFMCELERVMMLRVMDEHQVDNIGAMQELCQGTSLRAYGQNDLVVAYKKEGYETFGSMIAAIQAETIRRVFLAWIQVGATIVKRERVVEVTDEGTGNGGTVKKQPVKKGRKVGRNDPCPYSSGKRYRKCYGTHEDK